MYTVITIHDLTPEELAHAVKGVERTITERQFSRKADAVERFEYEKAFVARLGFAERVELRRDGVLLAANEQETRE